MCLFADFVADLGEFLTGNRRFHDSIIRKHTKQLERLGDVSFPLYAKNWKHVLNKSDTNGTIFDVLMPETGLSMQLKQLKETSRKWRIEIEKYEIIKENVHIFVNRAKCIGLGVKDVIELAENYGFVDKLFDNEVMIELDQVELKNEAELGLTELRMLTIRSVAENLVNRFKQASKTDPKATISVPVTINSQKAGVKVFCGAITNENGVKDKKTSTSQLWERRKVEMQLMAQHKYGIRVKNLDSYENYFEKLGKASIVIEMLANKAHKSTKITLNGVQTINKGPSFIFYNCARLSALFKEFRARVDDKTYPDLPPIAEIDFQLLTQAEEWELVFVYLMQFPLLLKSCICEIREGVVSLQHLVTFLSSLTALFSAYYRRVKILTIAKEHLFPLLFARLYMLKAVQQVLHTSLLILDIEPVKEM